MELSAGHRLPEPGRTEVGFMIQRTSFAFSKRTPVTAGASACCNGFGFGQRPRGKLGTRRCRPCSRSRTQAATRSGRTSTFHPDGSIVRVKPDGDPTSKFRLQPHASKSVSSPPDGDCRNFEDEGFKADNDENSMPKGTQRMLSTSWTAWPTTVIPT